MVESEFTCSPNCYAIANDQISVLKAHAARWSEDCPEHSGVVVYSMNDEPLGFGVTARSTAEAKKLEPTGIVVFRQADAGEYLREVRTPPILKSYLLYIDYGQLLISNRRIPCSPLEQERSTTRILHVDIGILDVENLGLEFMESILSCEKFFVCLDFGVYTWTRLDHLMNTIITIHVHTVNVHSCL
jgi:hypothetical protein